MRIKLEYPLSIGEISDSVKGFHKRENSNKIIKYITTDSRETEEGDLFVALSGEKHNGEDFVPDAIAKRGFPLSQIYKEGIYVENTATALLNLAGYYKKKFKNLEDTVAITGSVGKTTTKEFLKELCQGTKKTHATYKNFNNQIGVPLTILTMKKDTEILILEMGMNHRGEISLLSKCAGPTIGIITTIGTAHIGNLGSREEIAKAKLEITEGMKKIKLICPYNEPLLSQNNPITFAYNNCNSIYNINEENFKEISFFKGSRKLFTTTFQPMGKHLKECLCVSLAATVEMNLDLEDTKQQVSLISDKNTRQKIIKANNISYLADFYNASLESVVSALYLLNEMKGYTAKSVLLGDILETGNLREEINTALAKILYKFELKNIYLFGENSESIKRNLISLGFPIDKTFINDNTNRPDITAKHIFENSVDGEIILLKASRGMKLERILYELRIPYSD